VSTRRLLLGLRPPSSLAPPCPSPTYVWLRPILSDEEYNSLRSKLKAINSPALVHDAPSCKISDDGKQICKSDLTPDDGKNALLYTPALVLTALLVNEYCFWANHWDPLLSLIVGSPVIAGVTYILTNYIYFQKPFITKTQCPKCTTPQNIYFGDVLFCEGGKPSDVVKTACVNKACGCAMIATKSKSVLPPFAPPPSPSPVSLSLFTPLQPPTYSHPRVDHFRLADFQHLLTLLGFPPPLSMLVTSE
jgi:hypothetical protein